MKFTVQGNCLLFIATAHVWKAEILPPCFKKKQQEVSLGILYSEPHYCIASGDLNRDGEHLGLGPEGKGSWSEMRFEKAFYCKCKGIIYFKVILFKTFKCTRGNLFKVLLSYYLLLSCWQDAPYKTRCQVRWGAFSCVNIFILLNYKFNLFYCLVYWQTLALWAGY